MSVFKQFCILSPFLLIFFSCQKDDDQSSLPESPKIICNAGCSNMSWSIAGESGPKTTEQTCMRQYFGSKYKETCEGELTYINSGKSYQFKVIYDWPNCTMDLDVFGLGTCGD